MVVLFIFFVYGLTLDGASDGILYYVRPDHEKLKDFNVWSTAAGQVRDPKLVGHLEANAEPADLF